MSEDKTIKQEIPNGPVTGRELSDLLTHVLDELESIGQSLDRMGVRLWDTQVRLRAFGADTDKPLSRK